VVSRSGARGFSLVEVIISMTIFLVFLGIMFTMTTEMRGHEKRLPVNLMLHPETNAVMARMRQDVLSATNVPEGFEEYEQSGELLIVYSIQESGFGHTVVWDFRTPGIAKRRAYSAGSLVSEWMARGVPKISVTLEENEGRLPSVRVLARDGNDNIAIDQILQPRAHN
jgi:prepilin-type N-terminal cleavage/methylation domain-containing protein